jgi:osmotically inducible protein OsmC
MNRTATAVWRGPAKEGSGAITTQSKTLDQTPYSFVARFGDAKGTNPEELIAAAHAGCFSMALSFGLSNAGTPPETIQTEAKLSFEQINGAWTINAIHLEVVARVPGIDAETFSKAANDAKANCPVSRVLNATISMTARLAG